MPLPVPVPPWGVDPARLPPDADRGSAPLVERARGEVAEACRRFGGRVERYTPDGGALDPVLAAAVGGTGDEGLGKEGLGEEGLGEECFRLGRGRTAVVSAGGAPSATPSGPARVTP
ncbi:hypothetical protein AB0N88_36895 [Streptomyces sp. NPDC093516]|uniref:hypothetical protein n=1 Tax=Streptomyces sp. NPDC093516 TaxID=3155304 RepID=UPI003447E241